MIFYDNPRKYGKTMYRWSHITADTEEELEKFAKSYGLKRRDKKPYLHYDVTEDELSTLRSIGAPLVERKQKC